ncbi:MAG: hypothetical protein HYY24_08365 [Verrucomicrobia bacterium]|nr:hypothetical protein [Verrucomicrobiota bacterium]
MKTLEPRPDRFWKKSRIAARILLKKECRPLNARDRRLARRLGEDPGVTNRLIDQGIHWLKARKNGHRLLDKHH